MRNSEETQKRLRENAIKAHEIAKMACNESETYGGALALLQQATFMIEWQRDRGTPTAGEYPRDRYGREFKEEPPTAATVGGEETKIKGITVDITN